MISLRIARQRVSAFARGTLSLCLLSGSLATAVAEGGLISVIPKPMQMQAGKGAFTLARGTKIVVEKDSVAVAAIGHRLAEKLVCATELSLVLIEFDSQMDPSGTILLTTADGKERLGGEGYELTVTPDRIVVRAAKPAGVFYGVQTLLQLLPVGVKRAKPSSFVTWKIPAVQIEDRPRFVWRSSSEADQP